MNDIVDKCQYFRCGVFSIFIQISTFFLWVKCLSVLCSRYLWIFSLVVHFCAYLLTSSYLSIKLKFTDINHILVLFSLLLLLLYIVHVFWRGEFHHLSRLHFQMNYVSVQKSFEISLTKWIRNLNYCVRKTCYTIVTYLWCLRWVLQTQCFQMYMLFQFFHFVWLCWENDETPSKFVISSLVCSSSALAKLWL